jgi:hypothetical protein
MLARCMTHSRTVSSKNTTAISGFPWSQRPNGVRALAIKAAKDEYRLTAATPSQIRQKMSAAGQ